MLRRRNILLLILIVAIFICLMIATSWYRSHPAINLTTDSTPVQVELNTSSFTLNSSHKTIRPPKGMYNYRATYGAGDGTVSLYGTVNTTTGSATKIVLSYKAFSRQSIKQALCKADGVSMENCGDSYTPQGITFVADHSWAIVKVMPSDELGLSLDVLQLSNGVWQKIAGPVSNASDLQGLVPVPVLEAIGQ